MQQAKPSRQDPTVEGPEFRIQLVAGFDIGKEWKCTKEAKT